MSDGLARSADLDVAQQPAAAEPRNGRDARSAPPVRRAFVVYLVVFTGFVGYSLMITVFTPLLLRDHGHLLAPDTSRATRTVLLGVLLSLYPLGQFLGAPVLGALSDRWGRRPVLLASLAVSLSGYAVITASITVGSLPTLMVVCFVTGLGEANITLAQSVIADITDDGAQRATLFGYVYLASSLAYVAGPLAGGPLADPRVVSWARDWAPFAAVTGLVALTLIAVAVLLPNTRPVTPALAPTGLTNIVRDTRFRRLYLINAVFYLSVFGFLRMYPLYLVDRFHLTVGHESLFVAWVAVPIVVANLWLVRLLFRRCSPRAVLVAAGLLAGVSSLTVPLPGVLGSLWLTLATTSLGIGILLAFCAVQLSTAATNGEQGRVLGTNQSLQVGAQVLSGLLGGAIAALSTGAPLILFGGLSIIAAALSFGRFGARRVRHVDRRLPRARPRPAHRRSHCVRRGSCRLRADRCGIRTGLHAALPARPG